MTTGRFLLKRTLQGVFVIWGVVTVVFLLRFVTPGNPITFVAPLDASQALRDQIAAELGLNRPIYVQYVDYLLNLLQGDMGYSYISGTAASTRIFNRLPATLELAIAATIVAVILSIPLGVISATHRHQPADYGATGFSLVGISTPNFWLGIMLVLVLSVQFGLFPTSRRLVGFLPAVEMLFTEGSFDGLVTWLAHITLPAITLGTYFTALITRLTRSGMLDELGKTYIRALRAKGLPETLVRYKHALRNTLIPVITVVGLQLGTLIGGAVITEAVFAWPGLGTLVINAINARDWPMIQGSLIVIGAGFVIVNLLVDALYASLNPQVANE
ncbi:ABC transporter permease [Halococcus saccharolyticus]|uniref:Binding-protein-dependent transporters inner membrane component n=1 Tax=Halococcus saccharolyticus DSM 5350 TaxID=1227455 RepID=M0MLM9_9EURY|nr:ABC transporter permease [Halococcus saccharolyticus]EMA46551.1 binding-protein-dependent transporters inner membrane component [Halococcus saccharolyticus DSM 5350]